MGSRGGIGRQRFFLYAFLGSFFWCMLAFRSLRFDYPLSHVLYKVFVPGYLFQALSVFSWVCWIAPNNRVINQLFGYETGLGMRSVDVHKTTRVCLADAIAFCIVSSRSSAFEFISLVWVKLILH